MPSLLLPPHYTARAELSSGPGGRVLRVERDGEEACLRLSPPDDGELGETRAELELLAAVRHPGLARLVDHGRGPDGAWIARSWIEGRPLQEVADELRHDPRALGRLIAQLTPALDHLHRRGFVHADLKPANVIVREDGRPILTDFGLARRAGGPSRPTAGSLFSVAPEVLLGQAPDARADLFALGVLLHALLVRPDVNAREFYARFPHCSYFEASGTRPDDLPDWARDVTAGLLELDPSRRPGSALAVGRLLARRLDCELPDADPELELDWPEDLGHETWTERWLAGVRDEFQRFQASSGADASLLRGQCLVLVAGESEARFLERVCLRAALDRVPARFLDLSRQLATITSTGGLDRWARETVGTSRDACLFVHAPRDDRWAQRALDQLVRTCDQARGGSGSATLLVTASAGGAPRSPELWRELPVPPADLEHVERELDRALEFESRKEREAFARHLLAESGGSNDVTAELLRAYRDQGWIVPGDGRPRARGGIATATAALASDVALTPAANRLAAALWTRFGRASAEDVTSLAALEGTALAAAVEETVRAGLVRRDAETRELVLTARGVGAAPELTPEAWRALHLRALQTLPEEAPERRIVLALFAGEADGRELVELAQFHRERGCVELAIGTLDRVLRRCEATGRAPEPEWSGELALAWIALGEPERAEAVLARLEPATDDRSAAVRAAIRGHLARRNQDFEEAQRELARARELGLDDHGDLLLAEARLYYETRRGTELDALLEEVDSGARGAIHPRIYTNFQNIRAMHAFREGRVQEALDSLGAHLTLAQERDDTFHEAGVRINLAICQRRTGDWEKAIEQLEHAERLYEDSGFLPGLAQTRALLGGTLREAGRLSDAEPLLSSSLEIRERMGDVTGAHAVRGMLGMLHAEKGVPHAAIEELSRSAEELGQGARKADAELLAARLAEVRARVAAPSRKLSKHGVAETDDPRIWVSRARTLWLQGDPDSALEYALRAHRRASELELKQPEEEADFLLRRLVRDEPEPGAELTPFAERRTDYSNPLIDLDVELLRLLDESDLDPGRARLFAQALARRGRSDRAVRLYWAVRARCSDASIARECATEGDRLFSEISRGLTDAERGRFAKNLLGVPDPYPADLESRAASVTRASYEDREIELLLEVSRSLVEESVLSKLLGKIVESALALTGGQRGFLVLEEDGVLHFDTALDSRRGDIAAPEVEISASVVRASLESMKPLCISNASDDPVLASSPSVADLELRSILSCPFTVQGKLRGVIYVDYQVSAGAFDERAERLIAHLAHQAAVAIRQVRHVEEIEALNERLKSQVADTVSDLNTARAALREAGLALPPSGLVGSSTALRGVHELLARAANTHLPVLVTGPSGTGKELAARALHQLGSRSDGPFVSENCASLPESLIESEFFGYKRGAFTGADQDRAGMFERAQGGTIFLDEIGELSLELQAKLLRVLETGEVRRLGDSTVRQVDFRLVAATNRNLEAAVNEKTFRADLYYRLDALRIDMPPLSERVGDIPELVHHFLRQEEARSGVQREISKKVMAALCRRDWPGNVRELSNEVARLCVLSDGDLTDPDVIRAPAALTTDGGGPELLNLAQLERRAIEDALRRTNGDKEKAAKLLGTSRAKVYQRIKQWREEDELGSG